MITDNDLYAFAVDCRRWIHARPELSFQEKSTSDFVYNKLKEFGLTPITYNNNYGISCDVVFGNLPTILFRADMDALPITEQTGLPFSSTTPDVMHACGHDIHTAILLAVAKRLSELKNNADKTTLDKIKYNVRLVFQPAEETSPSGASSMIDDGVLSSPCPQYAVAIHVCPELPVGKIGVYKGAFMASADEIHLKVIGKGGHASTPQNNINPIIPAAEIITALSQLTKSPSLKDDCVLAIGKIVANGATNVIPDIAEISGTIRTFDEDDRQFLIEMVDIVATKITAIHGAKVENIVLQGYPIVVNDENLTSRMSSMAADFLGKENVLNVHRRMGADDFGFYAQKIPSCIFRLGCGLNSGKLHSSTFTPDEDCMDLGVKLLYNTILLQ